MNEPRDSSELATSAADDLLLVSYLSGRDVPCPLCGYNLRGLTNPRCPECGRDIQLSINLTEPFLRAWVALAIAVFSAAGIGLMFLALIGHLGWPPDLRGAGNAGMIYFLISPIFAWPTLAARRRFLRLKKPTQWKWAGLAIVLCTASLIAVAALLK